MSPVLFKTQLGTNTNFVTATEKFLIEQPNNTLPAGNRIQDLLLSIHVCIPVRKKTFKTLKVLQVFELKQNFLV